MAARKAKPLEEQGYSKLESFCIGLNEYYKALKKAGFSEAICLFMITEPHAYPDWIVPDLPNKIDPIEYDDED